MGRRRLPDPAWKSGPKEQKPTSSEHAIHPEGFANSDFDFDGFGVDEAERVEGEPLVVIQESAACTRDRCDATHKRRLLFTTQPLSDAEKHALDLASGADEPGVLVNEVAERVGPETIEANGLEITAEDIIEDRATGSCYGRVEPDPEPQWRDI